MTILVKIYLDFNEINDLTLRSNEIFLVSLPIIIGKILLNTYSVYVSPNLTRPKEDWSNIFCTIKSPEILGEGFNAHTKIINLEYKY